PHIGPREFLLRVMHDHDAPIRDRIRAASKLLRIYGEDSFHPRLTIRIAPFPDCYSLSTSSESEATDERLGNGSHSLEISHKAVSHSGRTQAPVNIETNLESLTFDQIVQLVRDTDIDSLPLCECGHRMFRPCHPVKPN